MLMLKLSIKKRSPTDEICGVERKVSCCWILSSNFCLRPEVVEEEKGDEDGDGKDEEVTES